MPGSPASTGKSPTLRHALGGRARRRPADRAATRTRRRSPTGAGARRRATRRPPLRAARRASPIGVTFSTVIVSFRTAAAERASPRRSASAPAAAERRTHAARPAVAAVVESVARRWLPSSRTSSTRVGSHGAASVNGSSRSMPSSHVMCCSPPAVSDSTGCEAAARQRRLDRRAARPAKSAAARRSSACASAAGLDQALERRRRRLAAAGVAPGARRHHAEGPAIAVLARRGAIGIEHVALVEDGVGDAARALEAHRLRPPTRGSR